MALSSAVIEQSTSKVFSYISTKLEDKALTAETIARIEKALCRVDFVLEKTGKIAITYVSLLRTWKLLKRAHTEGMDLLNKYRPQYHQPDGLQVIGEQAVVRSSSYLQRIANGAANLSISSLVGLSKDRLSSSVAKTYERYAELAEKYVAEVESSCPLRHVTSRYPFLKHLFEGKTLFGYKSVVKKTSQSLKFYLDPVIVQGRGVEVNLIYLYEDCRTLERYFSIYINLRVSEDTDIIGITIECMQWLTAQLKLAVDSAIGELTLLPSSQDIFHSYVPPPSCTGEEEEHRFFSEFYRPDPICCNGNSYGNLSNKSSMEIPEPVIMIYFNCYYVSPSKNSNAPLALAGLFAPHDPGHCSGKICIRYGGKEESRNGGSMQQLEEIARSDAIDYLVHEPEPTDYALFWFSPHGHAAIFLEQAKLRPGRRRVSKRKR